MTSTCSGQNYNVGQETESEGGFGDSCNWDAGWASTLQSEWPGASVARREALLASVIQSEVIPRLLLAHRGQLDGRATADDEREATASPVGTEVAQLPSIAIFTTLVHEQGFSETLDFVRKLLDRGVTADRLYLELLSPAARLMGIYWEDDKWSFTDVTLGLARLRQLVHEIGRRTQRVQRHAGRGGQAYFAPAPGDQHSFGLAIVDEFFYRAGWETVCDSAASEKQILKAVSQKAFDIVGFSVSCEGFLDPLSALIAQTRRVSRNRDIVIMVGGRIFQKDPSLADRFPGAVVAQDGLAAIRLAEEILPSPAVGASRLLM